MNSNLCENAKLFADWLPWKILIGTKLSIAFVAIYSSYFLIRSVVSCAKRNKFSQGVRWLIHPNAKILFGNHIFWSSIAPILYVILYIIDLLRLSIPHNDPCAYLVPTSFAVTFRTLHVSCAMAQNFSVLALALERLISVWFLEKYEKTKSPLIGVLFTCLVIVACILVPYCVYIFPFLGTGMMFSYTITISHRNEFNQKAAPLVSQIQLSTEITALLIFSATLFYSKYYNRKRLKMKTHSVHKAYQAVENEIIVKPLIFVFCLHFLICSMQATATATFNLWFNSGTLTDFAFYLEVFSQYPLYTILLTILLHKNSFLRRRKEITQIVNEIQEQEDYFKELKLMFNSELARKQKREKR